MKNSVSSFSPGMPNWGSKFDRMRPTHDCRYESVGTAQTDAYFLARGCCLHCDSLQQNSGWRRRSVRDFDDLSRPDADRREGRACIILRCTMETSSPRDAFRFLVLANWNEFHPSGSIRMSTVHQHLPFPMQRLIVKIVIHFPMRPRRLCLFRDSGGSAVRGKKRECEKKDRKNKDTHVTSPYC